MPKEVWINLPVTNAARAKEFYDQLGFLPNKEYGDHPNSASFFIGQKNIVMMLFEEPTFMGFTGVPIADAKNVAEVLFSIDAENKEEVDTIVQKAIAAGGSSSHVPTEMQGWMYGCVFSDPDGHRWNVLHMDMSKLKK